MIDYGKLLLYDAVENLEKMVQLNQIEVDFLEAPTEDAINKIAAFKNVKKIQRPAPLRFYIEFEGDLSARHQLLKEMLGADMKVVAFNPKGLALENLYMKTIKESR